MEVSPRPRTFGWHRLGPILSVVALVCLCAPPALEAQETVRRPFRRVFGGNPVRPGAEQRLDFRASLTETYDNSLLADGVGGGPQARTGNYPSGSVDLIYTRPLGRGTFNANGASTLQYYPQLDDRLDRSHSGGLDFSLPVGARTTVRVAQTVSYATFATLLGLPGSVITEPGVSLPGAQLLSPGESYGASNEGGWQFNTHAGLSRQVGRRGSLEGRYGFGRTDLASLPSTFNSAGGSYRYAVTREAALVAGYSYQRGGRGGDTPDVIFHDINLGMDYSRRLPGLRNTTLSFSTGSAVIVTDEGREFSLLGDARLVHLMGRTWTAGMGYHRGIEYAPVLGQLVASQAVTATVNGLPSPRLETWLSTSYSRGNLGSLNGSPITSRTAIARLQYALSSRFAVDTQYIYYFHDLGDSASIPGALTRQMDRSAIRVGLTLLLPVIR